MRPVTRDPAHELYDAHSTQVTLNGFPARIVGWRNDFPTVTAKTPHGQIAYEWSRAAIVHVITHCDGKFRS